MVGGCRRAGDALREKRGDHTHACTHCVGTCPGLEGQGGPVGRTQVRTQDTSHGLSPLPLSLCFSADHEKRSPQRSLLADPILYVPCRYHVMKLVQIKGLVCCGLRGASTSRGRLHQVPFGSSFFCLFLVVLLLPELLRGSESLEISQTCCVSSTKAPQGAP